MEELVCECRRNSTHSMTENRLANNNATEWGERKMRKWCYGNGRKKKHKRRRGFGFCDANDTLEITHNIVFSVPIMQ